MYFVFGVKGALFVSLVSRPHVLSPVQSLYPGLDICSVSCLIVAVVLTEEQTKNGFDVLMNTSAVTLCKHSFWTYQFQSRLLWTPGKVVRLPLCNEKPSNRDKFPFFTYLQTVPRLNNELYLLSMRKILLKPDPLSRKGYSCTSIKRGSHSLNATRALDCWTNSQLVLVYYTMP